MRLLIAGGGTGGHLFPAVAVARAVKNEDRAAEVLFVGTRHGIEAKILPESEFPFRFISARGLRKTGLLNTVTAAAEIPLGMLQSFSIIGEFHPTVVLGVGGYASGPTLAAAVILRIPTAIQEQNSVMGTTNRILARFVDRVFTSWETTEPSPPPGKTTFAGNPVRGDLFSAPIAAKEVDKFHLLVFGGSGGARSINQAMTQNLELLQPMASQVSIIHQTGAAAVEAVRQAYLAAGIEADVREFIYDMGTVYEWADLVVSRSGASTLAEITALGKPAVVVPYPYAIGDHQARNARVLESCGAVRVILDHELKNGRLVKEVASLAESRGDLLKMAENSRKLGRPDAAETIAQALAEMQRTNR